MDIARQVVTKRNDNNEIIATVRDYYDRYVHPISSKFRTKSLTKDKLVICPFHDDNDPSLGLIKDKQDREVEVFHCFGCGASGDIVRMHRRVEYLTKKRNITIEASAREVAEIYNITIDELALSEELDLALARRERDILREVGSYDIRAHGHNLMKLREQQESMNLDSFSKNIDVLLNKWKMVLKDN